MEREVQVEVLLLTFGFDFSFFVFILLTENIKLANSCISNHDIDKISKLNGV